MVTAFVKTSHILLAQQETSVHPCCLCCAVQHIGPTVLF